MRAFAFASAISLVLAGATQAGGAASPPRRVASLNLCTDELLLALAAPGQIASVTHLAQTPAETPLWREARRYRRNDGSLVSVAGLRPDLVLTMGGGARDRVRIAARLGIRTLDLPFPQSLAGLGQRRLRGDRISLEQLLVRPPALLLRSQYRSAQYSSEQRWLTHPLARHTDRSRSIDTDGRLWTCMGPLMIDEIVRLRREVAG